MPLDWTGPCPTIPRPSTYRAPADQLRGRRDGLPPLLRGARRRRPLGHDRPLRPRDDRAARRPSGDRPVPRPRASRRVPPGRGARLRRGDGPGEGGDRSDRCALWDRDGHRLGRARGERSGRLVRARDGRGRRPRHARRTRLDAHELARLSYSIERDDLDISGGWQDQYAAAFGGFNLFEFSRLGVLVSPIRTPTGTLGPLQDHLLLCYTGFVRRNAGLIDRRSSCTGRAVRTRSSA